MWNWNIYIYFYLHIRLFYFVGETSSGKSTILNSIIGKPILPVRHEAATQKVCRIRYSDELSVSLCNTAGHTVEKMAFKNTQEMKTTLPNIICDNGSDIKYVDIWYPVEILKVNNIVFNNCILKDFLRLPKNHCYLVLCSLTEADLGLFV